MEQFRKYTPDELQYLWRTTHNPGARKLLYKYLSDIHDPPFFPMSGGGASQEEINQMEHEYGLYPSLDDPQFHQKLLQKLEFAENKQEAITDADKELNLCGESREFELSAVQRFVARFLAPESPYQSALLYHGVGVGKTCAAVSIAENYLRIFPRKKVIIVAPPNIQPNFRNTIFNMNELRIPEDEAIANTHNGCTGNFYLQRTGTEFVKEVAVIKNRIRQTIDARYEFMGYIQFFRYIETVKRSNPKDWKKAVRAVFEGRMVIIDEAHNLRDVPGESVDDNLDSPGGDEEVADSVGGKRLRPSLIDVLDTCHGLKLVLLTATPMYNNYMEIASLLELLLRNDKRFTKKFELTSTDFFSTEKGKFWAEGGEEKLARAAGAYISFMRGENPLTFPVRLPPNYEGGVPKLESWPKIAPNGVAVPPSSAENVLRLPLVPVQFEGDSLETYLGISDRAAETAGVGVSSIDTMVQSGNWLFPSRFEEVAPEMRIRDTGFDACFKETTESGYLQYASTLGPPTWLLKENLGTVSPKAKFVLNSIQNAEGVLFVYSRFIKSGALPLILALEANGYTPYGRNRVGFLRDGVQSPDGLQCALCPLKSKQHKEADHEFVRATYVLLTGKASLSPNNAAMVAAATAKTGKSGPGNENGSQVKVIIGSQVASEGIDLKFIREIYVFDSWFHLNKMEQVLGRGVRTCSHASLEPKKQNTTIYLLVNSFPEEENRETADMYMYRTAMVKAQQVGKVSRVLKRYALDCNLNVEAIKIREGQLKDQEHVDAHAKPRHVEMHDTPFTAICDWIDEEQCDYTCGNKVEIDMDDLDVSTYDEYAAQWHETKLKQVIRKIFEGDGGPETPYFTLQYLHDKVPIFKSLPLYALRTLMNDIVDNQSFRIRLADREGYIVKRNKYYLFQPIEMTKTNLPIALRIRQYPVKRDVYEPPLEKVRRAEVTSVSIWSSSLAWAATIVNGTATFDIPEDMKGLMKDRIPNKSDLEKEYQHLFGILWFYQSMKDNEGWRKTLAEVLLGLVWDEFLTVAEQNEELAKEEGRAVAINAKQLVVKGSREAFRYVDTTTGLLKYVCGDKPCDVSVANLFDNDPTDPLNRFEANDTTMGVPYGFLVPNLKSKILVFKTTDKPAATGKAPPKGGVCEIVTQISHHFEELVKIGEFLDANGLPNFGLTMKDFTDTRKFQNASRACSIKNVILRWMDIRNVKGRRWFLRPVAAYKSNHQVLLEKPKKGRAKKGVAEGKA